MDIRTRLALAVVSVALLSMALLGVFAYQTSTALLQEISIRQLDALAESKSRELENAQAGWRDQVRLIRSRTRLLQDVVEYLETGSASAIQSIVEVIAGAATAVDDVDQIRILRLDGTEIAVYGTTAGQRQAKPAATEQVTFVDTILAPHGGVQVAFSTLLTDGAVPLGIVEVVFDARGIRGVTDDRTGLGETGEVLVVMAAPDDFIQVLNPLRHQETDGLMRLSKGDAATAMKHALSIDSDHQWLHVTDYRGVDVWAATRFLPELGWGIIVKVDAAEEGLRAVSLRDALFDIAIVLSAFAIVGGTLLGLYLARPIHDLAVLVGRIRHGESHLRASVTGDDEIAYLCESLNELLDHMQQGSSDRESP